MNNEQLNLYGRPALVLRDASTIMNKESDVFNTLYNFM